MSRNDFAAAGEWKIIRQYDISLLIISLRLFPWQLEQRIIGDRPRLIVRIWGFV